MSASPQQSKQVSLRSACTTIVNSGAKLAEKREHGKEACRRCTEVCKGFTLICSGGLKGTNLRCFFIMQSRCNRDIEPQNDVENQESKNYQ